MLTFSQLPLNIYIIKIYEIDLKKTVLVMGDVLAGEPDEADLEEARKKFSEEYKLEAYGRLCPERYINQ